MKEWRCTKCNKHLINFDVIDGAVVLERICPRCGARNVDVIRKGPQVAVMLELTGSARE